MRRAHLDQHHVVELEPLRLLDLRHLDARREGEVVTHDVPEPGHLGAGEPAVIERAQLGGRREHRDRRERLLREELLQGVRQMGDAGAVVREAEELDGRSRADGRRGSRVLAEIAQEASREGRDLLRAAVAHAQRAHLGAGEAELGQERRPRREAALLEEMLLRVARERDRAALVEAAEEHAHLERREVLDLVDRDVTVAERASRPAGQRSRPELPGAQQDRLVGLVELRLGFRLPGLPGEELLVAGAAPIACATQVVGREGVRELVAQRLRMDEDARPVVDHPLGRRRAGSALDVPRQHALEARMELQPLHDRRRVLAGGARQPREEAAALLGRPFVEGPDLDAAHVERGQHVAHVVAERGREDDHERLG